MKISEIRIEQSSPGRLHLSTVMNDEPLWFDVPEPERLPETYADSFLIMGLPGSMLRGETLEVSDKYPISKKLLEKVSIIQKMMHVWNPAFKIVPVEAVAVENQSSCEGVASFFSGGVDSIATLINHRHRIDSALYIGGFDFAIDRDTLSHAVSRNSRILDQLEIPQIVVHSNQQQWGTSTGVSRVFCYSGYLAAAAFLTAPATFLVPSSHTYNELTPTGSHPMLDPLWGNGEKAIEHVDLEFSRSQKVETISSFPEILANLHVCWRDPDKNCGSCDKCIRTMIPLNLLGLQGPFPHSVSVQEVASFKATEWEGLSYLIDNAMLAHKVGRKDMVKALKKALRRYDRSKALEHFDRGVFGGYFRRLRMKFKPYTERVSFTNGRPDLDI